MYKSSQTLITRKVVITIYSMGRKLQHKDMNRGNAILFVMVHVLKILQDITHIYFPRHCKHHVSRVKKYNYRYSLLNNY